MGGGLDALASAFVFAPSAPELTLLTPTPTKRILSFTHAVTGDRLSASASLAVSPRELLQTIGKFGSFVRKVLHVMLLSNKRALQSLAVVLSRVVPRHSEGTFQT